MLRITSSLRLPVATSSSSSSSISSALSHSSSSSSSSQHYYVASRAGHTYRFLLNQQQQQQKESPSSKESLFVAHPNDRERLQKPQQQQKLINKNENSPRFTTATSSSSSTSSAIQLSRELSTILSDCSKLVDYTISVIKNTPLNSTEDELLSSCSSLSGISLNHWHRAFDLLSQALRNNNNSTNNNFVTNYDEQSTPQSTQKVSTLHFNLALAIASKCRQWYPMQQCEGVMASSAFNNNNNNNTHSESSNKNNNTNDDKFKSSSSSLYWADVHTLNIFMAASLSTGDWMNALELFQSGLEEEEERLRRLLIIADDSSSSSSASSQKQQQQQHLHHINNQSIKLALRAAVEGSQGASPNYSLLLSSSASASSSSATRNHQAQRIRRIIQQYHHLQQQHSISNTSSLKYYFTPRWQEALNLHKLFPHQVESDPMMISLVVRAAASNARLDGKVLKWWRKTSQQQQQQQRSSSSSLSSLSLDSQARLDLSRVAERSLSWETALELAIRTCIISEQQQEHQQQKEARAATRNHFKSSTTVIIKKLVSSAIVTAHRAGQDQAVVSLFHYCKVLDLMMIKKMNKENTNNTNTSRTRTEHINDNNDSTNNNNKEEVKITAVLQDDPQSLSCIALSCSRLGKLNELVTVKQRANELLGYVPSEIYHAMLSLLDRHYYHSCLHHNYNDNNNKNNDDDDFGTSDIIEDDENPSSKSSSSSVTMILSKQRELIRDWLMSASSSSSLPVLCRKLFSSSSNDNDTRTGDVCMKQNDNAFDSTSSSSSSSLSSSSTTISTTSTASLYSQAFDELLSQTQNPDCMTLAAASEILVQLFHLNENKKYEAGNNDDTLSSRVVKLLELASAESSSSSSSSSSYFQRPMFASCISSMLEILMKIIIVTTTTITTQQQQQQQQEQLFTRALQCCLQMKFDDGPIFKKALNTAMKKMTMMNSKFMTDANNTNISPKEIFHPPIKSASSSSLSLIHELKRDDTSKLLFLMDKVNRLRFDDDHDQQEKSLSLVNEIIQEVTEGDADHHSLIVSKTIILSLLRKLFSHSSLSSSSSSTADTLLNEVLSSLEMLLETQQQQQQQHSVLHFTLTDDDCRGFLDQYTIKERLRLLLATSASSDFSHILETEKLAKLLVRFTDLFYNFAIASPFSQQNRLPAALAECVLNLLEHLAMMVHDAAAAHVVASSTSTTSTSSVSDVESETQEKNTTKSSSSLKRIHLLSQIELFCWKEADKIYNRMMSVESMSRFRNRLAFAKISAVLASSSSSSLSSCSTSQTVFGDDTKTNNNSKIKNSSIVTTTTNHDGTKKRTTLTRSYVASIAIKLLCKNNTNNNNNNNTDYIAKHLSKIRNPTLIATIINRLGTTMKKEDKVKLLQSQWSSSSSSSTVTTSQTVPIARKIDNSPEENGLSTRNNTSSSDEIMTLFTSHLRTDPDSLSTKAISMAIQGINTIASSSSSRIPNNNNNKSSIPQPLIEILSSVQAADDGIIATTKTASSSTTKNGQLTGRCALAIISSYYYYCSDGDDGSMMTMKMLKTIKMLKTVFDRLLTQAAVEGIDTTKSDYWKGAAACLVVRVSHEILLSASVISNSSAENIDSELSKIFEESISTFRRICSLNTSDDSNSGEEGNLLLLISRLKNCIRNIADDLLPSCYLWSSLMMSLESGAQPNKNKNNNHNNHLATIFAKKCTLCVALASIHLSSLPPSLEIRDLGQRQQQQQPRSLLEAFGLGANVDILMMSPPTSMVTTTTSHHTSTNNNNNNNSNNSIELIQEASIEWIRKEIEKEEHHDDLQNRRGDTNDDVFISSRKSLLRFHTTRNLQQKNKTNAKENNLALQPSSSFSVVDDCLHLLSAGRKRPAKPSPSVLEHLLRKLIMPSQNNKIETTNTTALHRLESTLSSFVFPLLLEINPSSISPISAVIFLAAVEVVKEASIDENDINTNNDNDDNNSSSFIKMATTLISEKIANVSNDSSLVCDFLLSPEAIEISKIVVLPLVRYTNTSTASLFHQHQRQDQDDDDEKRTSLPLLSYSLCSCLFRICVSNNAWTLAEQIRVMGSGSSIASDFSLTKNDNLLLVESLVEYLTKSNNKIKSSSSSPSLLSPVLIDAFFLDTRDMENNKSPCSNWTFVSDLVRMSCCSSSSDHCSSFDDVKFLSGLKLLEEFLSINNIQLHEQQQSSSSLTHSLLIELIKMKNSPKSNFVILMNNNTNLDSSVVLVKNIFDQFLRHHSASIVLQFLSLASSSSSSSSSSGDLIRKEIVRVFNANDNNTSPLQSLASHLPKSNVKKKQNNKKERQDLVDENLKKRIATMTRPILKLSGGNRDNNKKHISTSSSSFRDLLLGRSSNDSPKSSSSTKNLNNKTKLQQSILQWFVLNLSSSPDKQLMSTLKKAVTISSLLNVCHLMTMPRNSSSDVHRRSSDDDLIYELGFSAIDNWVLLNSPKKEQQQATIKLEEQTPRHYDEIFDFLELWTGHVVSSSFQSDAQNNKHSNKVPLLVTLERTFKTLLAHNFVEMTRYLQGRNTPTNHRRQLNLKNTATLINNLCSFCVTQCDESSSLVDDMTGVEEIARDVKESFLKLIAFLGDVESLLLLCDHNIDENRQRRLVKSQRKNVVDHHHHHVHVFVGCCFLEVRSSEESKKINEHAADENGMMTTLAIRKYRQLLTATTTTTTNGTRHQQPRSKKPSKEFYAFVAKVMKTVINATSQQNQQTSIEDLMVPIFNQVMGRQLSTPTVIAAPRPRVVSPPPPPPPATSTTLPVPPANNINEGKKQDQSQQSSSSSSSSSWQQAIEYAQEYINTTKEIVSNLNKNSDDKNISSTTKSSQQKLTELTQKLMSSDDHHGGLKSIIDSHQAIKNASSVSSWVVSSRIFAELLSLSNNENTTTTKKNNSASSPSSSSSALSILAQLHRRRLDLIYSFARRHLWHVQRWSTDSSVVKNQASVLALAALDYEQKRSEKLNKKQKMANKKINNQRRQEITSATNKKSLIIRSQPFLFLLMDLTKPAAQSSSNTSMKTTSKTDSSSPSVLTEDSSIPLPLRIFDELVSDEFVSSSSTSSKTVDGTLQSFEPLNCALESLIVMKRQQQHKHQQQRCLYYAELIVERFVRAAPELLKRSKEDAKEAAAARKFVSLMVGESGVSAKSLEKVLAVIGSYRE